MSTLILLEPEELLRGGEEIGSGARRARKLRFVSLRLPKIRDLAKRELARVKPGGPEGGIKGLRIAAGVLPSDVSVREERIEAGYPFVPVRAPGLMPALYQSRCSSWD
jgi:hypothetical protein